MEFKKQNLYMTKDNKALLYVSNKWIQELGLDRNNKEVTVYFTGDKIIIEPFKKK